MAETELHYFHKPAGIHPVTHAIEFVTSAEFTGDEPACKSFWELLSTQFHTRGKFLAVWSGVKFVAVSRDADGAADGFLLVNAPINWQIDYVVVRPDRRGNGIAATLVQEALNEAYRRGVPYVMLTSRASLRPLYESCGFTPIESAESELFSTIE